MRIGLIGDIVGRPGRKQIRYYLNDLKDAYKIDFVIANSENVSHGFGINQKHLQELINSGIDLFTGGNHSFDKKEIIQIIDNAPLLRPLNLPKEAPGRGMATLEICGIKVAVISLMGQFAMPLCDNPFTLAKETVQRLKAKGFKHILIDMHAEATAEKATLFHLLKSEVSAIWGTHTHVGTDDLMIDEGCVFVTDIGLAGCIDGVIGMKPDIPIHRVLKGIGGNFEIDNGCKSILQIVIVDIDDNGRAVDATKLKLFDDGRSISYNALKLS